MECVACGRKINPWSESHRCSSRFEAKKEAENRRAWELGGIHFEPSENRRLDDGFAMLRGDVVDLR